MESKVILILILISAIGKFSFQKVTDFMQIDESIVGTKWSSEGYNGLLGDSLFFINETDVKYFMGELAWVFDSKYEISTDTLIIQTVLVAFEIEDITGMNPDLIQKYTITGDSLILIYLANFRNNRWVDAEKERYKIVNNFWKIR